MKVVNRTGIQGVVELSVKKVSEAPELWRVRVNIGYTSVEIELDEWELDLLAAYRWRDTDDRPLILAEK